MRIAFCLEYPIDQRGGTEVLVSELVKGLGQEHEIILISPDTEISVAKSPVASFVKQHISSGLKIFSSQSARALANKIAAVKPDIVHFHFGGNYAWGNRFPYCCPIYFLNQLGFQCVSTVHRA